MLGRVSAPLFLFCTVEGFAHTHDRKTYLLRLWALGAGMGLIQFLIGIGIGQRADGFYPMNGILRDLTIACLLWQGIDWVRQRRFGRALALIGGAGVVWPAVSLALMSVLPPVGQLPVYFLSWTVLPSWTFWAGCCSTRCGSAAGRRRWSGRRGPFSPIWAAFSGCCKTAGGWAGCC